MSEITIRQMQKTVDEWVRTIGVRYYSELTNTAEVDGQTSVIK